MISAFYGDFEEKQERTPKNPYVHVYPQGQHTSYVCHFSRFFWGGGRGVYEGGYIRGAIHETLQ